MSELNAGGQKPRWRGVQHQWAAVFTLGAGTALVALAPTAHAGGEGSHEEGMEIGGPSVGPRRAERGGVAGSGPRIPTAGYRGDAGH
jgi:hypothetical protein